MADAVMNFGYSLCEGYPALILCSLLLLAYLMKELFPDIYAYHTGLKNEYKDGKTLKHYGNGPSMLQDPQKISLDKNLCFIASAICLFAYSLLCCKIVLYILGFIVMFLGFVLEAFLAVIGIIIAIFALLIIL